LVELDPCKRLETIQRQILPSIVHKAGEEEFEDIRYLIDTVLPDLELRTIELAARCAEIGGPPELCDIRRIKEMFRKAYDDIQKKLLEKE
jgi:hypothetical protein